MTTTDYRAFTTIKYGCLFVKDLDAHYKEGRIAKTQDLATHKRMKCYKTQDCHIGLAYLDTAHLLLYYA